MAWAKGPHNKAQPAMQPQYLAWNLVGLFPAPQSVADIPVGPSGPVWTPVSDHKWLGNYLCSIVWAKGHTWIPSGCAASASHLQPGMAPSIEQNQLWGFGGPCVMSWKLTYHTISSFSALVHQSEPGRDLPSNHKLSGASQFSLGCAEGPPACSLLLRAFKCH